MTPTATRTDVGIDRAGEEPSAGPDDVVTGPAWQIVVPPPHRRGTDDFGRYVARN
jgi:hypothetical protein